MLFISQGIDKISRDVVSVEVENTKTNIILVKMKLENLSSADFISRLALVNFIYF